MLFFLALITVASATNLTETFFAEHEWPCIQDCYSKHGFNGEIKLIEMVLPEFSLIFDICNVVTLTRTCADHCKYENAITHIKPFAYLCDSATLSELKKHEVCYTDVNNAETKSTCGGRCGGHVDEMANKMHHLMMHHLSYGPSSNGVINAAAVRNATIETCRWQKCYVRCTVDNLASLCRVSDPGASNFSRTMFEELGYAYYDDMKTMGLIEALQALPEQCNFMSQPSSLFADQANPADATNVHIEEGRNEEEFWKQRQLDEEKMWSPCLKKCAADINYSAQMDRFDEVNRGGDDAEQFLSLYTMCRANDELRQCLSKCDRSSVHPDDMSLADALCDKQLFTELQAHEQCYGKSRDAKTECHDRCSREGGDQQERRATGAVSGDKETCRMRKCRMRCHYNIVVDTCDGTDPEASKFMLNWFNEIRRGAGIFIEGEHERGAMEAVLAETPQQCHYFINKNVSLFDDNSSIRCSVTYTCLTFSLLLVLFSLFQGYFIH